MKLYLLAWRNVLRNKRRTIIACLAIAIAALSILFLFSLLTGLGREMRENLQRYYFGEIRLRHSEFEANEQLNPLHLSVENASSIVNNLRQSELLQQVAGRLQFPSTVYQDGEESGVFMRGIEMEHDPIELSEYLLEGTLPEAGKREVVLGLKASEELGVGIGDKFTALTMTLRRSSNGMTFEVVGIASLPLNDLNSAVYLPLDTAQRFLKAGDRAVDIVMRSRGSIQNALVVVNEDLKANISETGLNEDIVVEAWNTIPSAYTFIVIAQVVYYIIGMAFYLLASTVIINTIMMIIFERTREIGTLASMGMEGNTIVRMFFLEAFYISAIGSGIGVALGSILILVLEHTGIDLSQALGEIDFQISGIIYPKLTLANIVIALLSGIFVASGISLIPSRRAAKIQPVEAMKETL